MSGQSFDQLNCVVEAGRNYLKIARKVLYVFDLIQCLCEREHIQKMVRQELGFVSNETFPSFPGKCDKSVTVQQFKNHGVRRVSSVLRKSFDPLKKWPFCTKIISRQSFDRKSPKKRRKQCRRSR